MKNKMIIIALAISITALFSMTGCTEDSGSRGSKSKGANAEGGGGYNYNYDYDYNDYIYVPEQNTTVNKSPCVRCDGTGKMACDYCHGAGRKDHTGYAPNFGYGGDTSYQYTTTCTICHGSGRVTCTLCYGKGSY